MSPIFSFFCFLFWWHKKRREKWAALDSMPSYYVSLSSAPFLCVWVFFFIFRHINWIIQVECEVELECSRSCNATRRQNGQHTVPGNLQPAENPSWKCPPSQSIVIHSFIHSFALVPAHYQLVPEYLKQ